MIVDKCGQSAMHPSWQHSNRIYNILRFNYIVFPCTLLLTFFGIVYHAWTSFLWNHWPFDQGLEVWWVILDTMPKQRMAVGPGQQPFMFQLLLCFSFFKSLHMPIRWGCVYLCSPSSIQRAPSQGDSALWGFVSWRREPTYRYDHYSLNLVL